MNLEKNERISHRNQDNNNKFEFSQSQNEVHVHFDEFKNKIQTRFGSTQYSQIKNDLQLFKNNLMNTQKQTYKNNLIRFQEPYLYDQSNRSFQQKSQQNSESCIINQLNEFINLQQNQRKKLNSFLQDVDRHLNLNVASLINNQKSIYQPQSYQKEKLQNLQSISLDQKNISKNEYYFGYKNDNKKESIEQNQVYISIDPKFIQQSPIQRKNSKKNIQNTQKIEEKSNQNLKKQSNMKKLFVKNKQDYQQQKLQVQQRFQNNINYLKNFVPDIDEDLIEKHNFSYRTSKIISLHNKEDECLKQTKRTHENSLQKQLQFQQNQEQQIQQKFKDEYLDKNIFTPIKILQDENSNQIKKYDQLKDIVYTQENYEITQTQQYSNFKQSTLHKNYESINNDPKNSAQKLIFEHLEDKQPLIVLQSPQNNMIKKIQDQNQLKILSQQRIKAEVQQIFYENKEQLTPQQIAEIKIQQIKQDCYVQKTYQSHNSEVLQRILERNQVFIDQEQKLKSINNISSTKLTQQSIKSYKSQRKTQEKINNIRKVSLHEIPSERSQNKSNNSVSQIQKLPQSIQNDDVIQSVILNSQDQIKQQISQDNQENANQDLNKNDILIQPYDKNNSSDQQFNELKNQNIQQLQENQDQMYSQEQRKQVQSIIKQLKNKQPYLYILDNNNCEHKKYVKYYNLQKKNHRQTLNQYAASPQPKTIKKTQKELTNQNQKVFLKDEQILKQLNQNFQNFEVIPLLYSCNESEFAEKKMQNIKKKYLTDLRIISERYNKSFSTNQNYENFQQQKFFTSNNYIGLNDPAAFTKIKEKIAQSQKTKFTI